MAVSVSIVREGGVYTAIITGPKGEEIKIEGTDLYDLVEEVVLKIEEVIGG